MPQIRPAIPETRREMLSEFSLPPSFIASQPSCVLLDVHFGFWILDAYKERVSDMKEHEGRIGKYQRKAVLGVPRALSVR